MSMSAAKLRMVQVLQLAQKWSGAAEALLVAFCGPLQSFHYLIEIEALRF
jgi:hypothetical protein